MGALGGLSWDVYRITITRKDHRWHIFRVFMEQGATQVFVHCMCPGTRVFVLLYVATCDVKLNSGDQQVKFSEHNQDGY